MTARRHRLYHRLQLAAHLLQEAADRELGRTSALTTAQATVLSVLVRGAGARQREVARTLGLNESAMTPMVERLMRLGYVERHRSDLDRRAWDLAATDAGRAALEAIQPSFRRVNRQLDASLSPEEIETMVDGLNRLIDRFGATDRETT
jgi:MarR family transcriptional regulator, organic hydroperoxide resistance regulator